MAGHLLNGDQPLEEDVLEALTATLPTEYGFIFPTEKVLAKIKEFVGNDSVLSVNCHNGFIEGMLQNQGVNIVASNSEKTTHRYIDIAEQDAIEAVQQTDRNVLMLSSLFQEGNPQKHFQGRQIIHIGNEEDRKNGLPNEEWQQVFPPPNENGHIPRKMVSVPSCLDRHRFASELKLRLFRNQSRYSLECLAKKAFKVVNPQCEIKETKDVLRQHRNMLQWGKS